MSAVKVDMEAAGPITMWRAASWDQAFEALDTLLLTWAATLECRANGVPMPDMRGRIRTEGGSTLKAAGYWIGSFASTAEVEALLMKRGGGTVIRNLLETRWRAEWRQSSFSVEEFISKGFDGCNEREAKTVAIIVERREREWRSWAVRELGWIDRSTDNAKKAL